MNSTTKFKEDPPPKKEKEKRKKESIFWESFPKCVNQTHPPQGFCEKFGSKKAIFGVICFSLRDLDLVWESATPPIHIWENFPK